MSEPDDANMDSFGISLDISSDSSDSSNDDGDDEMDFAAAYGDMAAILDPVPSPALPPAPAPAPPAEANQVSTAHEQGSGGVEKPAGAGSGVGENVDKKNHGAVSIDSGQMQPSDAEREVEVAPATTVAIVSQPQPVPQVFAQPAPELAPKCTGLQHEQLHHKDGTAGKDQQTDDEEAEFSDSEWDDARAGDALGTSRDSYARRSVAREADQLELVDQQKSVQSDDDSSDDDSASDASHSSSRERSSAASEPEPDRAESAPPRQTRSALQRSDGCVKSMAARRAEAALFRKQREKEELEEAKARAMFRPVRKSAAELADAAEQLHRQSDQAEAAIAAKRQLQVQDSAGRLHTGKRWHPAGEVATRLLKPRSRAHRNNTYRQTNFRDTLRSPSAQRCEQPKQPMPQQRRPRRQQRQAQPKPLVATTCSPDEPLFLEQSMSASITDIQKEIQIVHREREAFKTRLVDALVTLEDCKRVQQQAAVARDQLLDVRCTII